jgi:hypothetical protein
MTETDSNIIKALGIETLSDEEKAKILDQSATMIEQRLLLRLMKSLDDGRRDELNQILSTDDKSQLDEFIFKQAPDFADWVVEETEALKKELQGLGNEID